MTNSLKSCPFCGCEAKQEIESWTNPNGSEWGSGRYTYIYCPNCKAKGGYKSIDNFNIFSKYSVKDFRESNLLRAIEDERYDAYIEQQKQAAIDAWNMRGGL
jgi:hypothetical protein